MSRAQHFKTISTNTMPSPSALSEQLDLGWDVVSIVQARSGHGGFTTYFKKVNVKEPKS